MYTFSSIQLFSYSTIQLLIMEKFYSTCRTGTLFQVQKCCPKFAKTKIIKSQYTKAFVIACTNGNLKVAQWLLKTNVNIITRLSKDPFDFYDDGLGLGFNSLLRNVCNSGYITLAAWLYDNLYSKVKPMEKRNMILKRNLEDVFQIGIIEWIVSLPIKRIKLDCSQYFWTIMRNDKLELLQRIHSEKCIEIIPTMFYEACINQKMEFALWMRTINNNFYLELDDDGSIIRWRMLCIKDRLVIALEQNKDIKSFFSSKSRSKLTHNECHECHICYDDDIKYFLEYSCKHIFCINCSLINTSDRCPYCRRSWCLSESKLLINSN
jgi:hypothetical protein